MIALKMAARNFLLRYTAFELQIFNDSIGIRLRPQCISVKYSSPPSLAQSSIVVLRLLDCFSTLKFYES